MVNVSYGGQWAYHDAGRLDGDGRKEGKDGQPEAGIFWAGVRQNKGESMLGVGFRDISAHAVSRNKGRFQGQA